MRENPSSARCRFLRCSSASGVWPELASGMLWDRNVQGWIACAWPVDSSARENIHVAVMHKLKIVWIVQVVRTSASLGAADPVSSDYPERKSSGHDGSMLSPHHNHMRPTLIRRLLRCRVRAGDSTCPFAEPAWSPSSIAALVVESKGVKNNYSRQYCSVP